jgi:hypothetical protein
MSRIVVVSFLMVAAATAHAQVCRWVDDQGTVHYSNSTPPKGAKATV